MEAASEFKQSSEVIVINDINESKVVNPADFSNAGQAVVEIDETLGKVVSDPKKPKKGDYSPEAVELWKTYISHVIVREINLIYSETTRSSVTDKVFCVKDVDVEFDKDKNTFSATAFCHDCRKKQTIPIVRPYHSITFKNFHRHLTTMHISKGQYQEKQHTQLKIDEMLSKKTKSNSEGSITPNQQIAIEASIDGKIVEKVPESIDIDSQENDLQGNN